MNQAKNIRKALGKIVPESRIKTNEPLSNHTYIKISGPADVLVEVMTSQELSAAYKLALQEKVPVFILGGGSNILVSDLGIRGLVIKNRADSIKLVTFKGDVKQKKMSLKSATIEVDSGVITNHLVRYSIDQGLAGLEYFLGIPGTVGGAIYNNSHYQNQLIGSHVDSVTAINSSGETITLNQDQLKFDYDYSIFHKTRDVIVSVQLTLVGEDKTILWKNATQYAKKRATTQPLSIPNSGCMFKNLTQKQVETARTGFINSTGYLIDQAGLKGERIGNAAISDKHANFVINLGDATADDVHKLVKLVTNKIMKKYRIRLSPEVFFIGPDIDLVSSINKQSQK